MFKKFRKEMNDLKQKRQFVNTYMDKYHDDSAKHDFFSFFVRIICKIIAGERCGIYITDLENKTVWLEAGTGFERKEIAVPLTTNSMVGKVISTGTAIINNDMAAQEGFHKNVDSSSGLETRNGICVPVKSLSNDRVTGAIQMLNKENGEVFTEKDQQWLEYIAENIQFNIEQTFLQQETLSLMDRISSTLSKLWLIFLITVLLFLVAMFVGSIVLALAL